MCGLKCYLLLITSFFGASVALLHGQWNVTCPEPCSCVIVHHTTLGNLEYETLDCSNHKLRDLPSDLPYNTQVVDLQHNKLSSLPLTLLGMPNLTAIDLSHNSLLSLSDKPVAWNLTHLTSLNLQANRLHSLTPATFKGLGGLRQLNLANNNISLIESSTFEGLDKLEVLNLRKNYLGSLESKWFKTLTSLQELDIGDNNINSLGNHAFSSLSSLNKLSVDKNSITAIDKTAFVGLHQLNMLNLASNKLSNVIGKAFSVLDHLDILTLNDNPVGHLNSKFLSNCQMKELCLSNMSNLQWIEKEALYNLPNLVKLELHSNPMLSYVHPEAVIKAPQLETIHLHNNNLLSLPEALVDSLPKLHSISLYDNPLRCDCNIKWLADVIKNSSASVNTTTMLEKPNQLTCKTPIFFKGQTLFHVASHLPTQCPPTVIPMFDDTYQKQIGGTLTLQCKAIGIPEPKVIWKLPHGEKIAGRSNRIRIHSDPTGVLDISSIKASDIGTFTCIAINSKGKDSAHTYLHVHNHYVHIMHSAIATNFITLTWNGTSKTIGSTNYVILYRQAGLQHNYHKVHIAPYMRSYTITNLKPMTMYEFCIGLDIIHKSGVVVLHCIRVRTQNQAFLKRGIENYSSLAIIVVMCTAVICIFMICLCVVLVKRHKRRHSYKEPEVGPPDGRVATMSQIPLDNLYQPPSTPLYTSKTSLIPKA